MEQLLGDRLKARHVLTDAQLNMALERQHQHGGRLGSNLIALGLLTEEQLAAFLKQDPLPPESVEQCGLKMAFIIDLIMKHLLLLREFTIQEVVDQVKLPVPIVNDALEEIRGHNYIEVKGASGLNRMSYRFTMTDLGKRQANELMEVSRYVGPAPVTLADYRQMVEIQTIKHILVSEDAIADAFSHLTVSDNLLRRLGPAISSGRAIFLYGPPGNGKTVIAETISQVLPDHIYMPYAVLVGDDIIVLYDPVNHVAVDDPALQAGIDRRWMLIKRPIVMTGGELDLSMLDLDFNPIAKFYQAPLQMKANNGIFIVDDFGRQRIEPQQLLNRWIVPLERRTDFLSLETGMKFEIPFDQLIIFSTNIEPKRLVDEAFLRRIRYKIRIDHPSEEDFTEIFRNVCASTGVQFDREMLDYLMAHFYRRLDIKLNACHPRDIIEHIIDDAHYHGHTPRLSRESLTAAWENYFVDL